MQYPKEQQYTEQQEVSPQGPSYFEIQAYIGTTKHLGGLKSTQELIALCAVQAGDHVLDVGCGAGATPVYLAKRHDCRVIGVDISEDMVALARERAQQEGVADRVQIRTADAQELPFEDDLFDIVLCESVTTFIDDKLRAVQEYARVAKPGGSVGLNEEIWLQTPPPAAFVEYVAHTWDIHTAVLTADSWMQMMESCGLEDVQVRTQRFDARREATQLGRYRLRDLLGMVSRSLSLYIRSPVFRRYTRERRRLPKGFFEAFGYGLFVGRKPNI